MNSSSNKKRPWFPFYPKDWLIDMNLQSCSWQARGLWIQLMCFLHDSDEYGKFILNGVRMTQDMIKIVSGMEPRLFSKTFAELCDKKVIRQDEDGTYFSKRMVEDERVRKESSEYGKMGGNPQVVKGTVKGRVNPPVKPPHKPITNTNTKDGKRDTKVSLPPNPEKLGEEPGSQQEDKQPKSKVLKLVVPEEFQRKTFMRDVSDESLMKKSYHQVFRLACKLYRNAREVYPEDFISVRDMKMIHWIEPVYYMINVDKREIIEVEEVQRLALQEPFHRRNLRFTTYLRRNYELIREDVRPKLGKPTVKTDKEKDLSKHEPY